MTVFDRLGREIAAEQDALRARATHRADVRDTLDGLRLPAHGAGASRRRFDRIGGVRGVLLAGVGAAAALAAAWVILASRPIHPPLTASAVRSGAAIAVGAWIEASGAEAFAIRFSDGTRVEIAPGARARLVELDANGAHLLLESGRASLRVEHRPHARWRVSAGPFAVHVVGTRFDVQWDPEQDQFQLELAQGAVDVSGCAVGHGYHMRAGQRIEASCKRGHFDIAEVAAEPARVAAALPEPPSQAEPTSVKPDPAQPAIAVDTRAVDTRAVDTRAAHAARRAPQPIAAASAVTPGAAERPPEVDDSAVRVVSNDFERACASAGVEELASLADAAHYAGDRAREARAWRLLRRRFPGTSHAALAAFALGRLEFDIHGSYPKAAQWFGTYLKEQPAGALVREARGRLMEATLRAGDTRAARTLGTAYLRDFPAGPHADLARSLEPAPAP